MSSDKDHDRDKDYDPLTEAMSFGTIWTTSLFESSDAPYKISRGGKAFRIPRQIVWWGIPGFIIGLFLGWVLLVKLFNGGTVILPIVLSIGIIFGAAFSILGRWSPMKKDTGEDLKTYIMIKLRKRIATGRTLSGKTSVEYYNSKAIDPENGGRIVKCQMWLGTQPLSSSAPKNPYYQGVYVTPYKLERQGEFKIFDSIDVDDGLNSGFE